MRLSFKQCVIPVLDGLLPEPHNSTILDLVFVMGCWHAYAKLRLHTERTLASFEHITSDLGALIRHFSTKTCSAFKTTELPREKAARMRRAANSESGSSATGRGSKDKVFNLHTYKLHALGHYPQTIREFGTTDNYNSQRVSETYKAVFLVTLTFTIRYRWSWSIGPPRHFIRGSTSATPREILDGCIAAMRC
jgi:hypothetical protein